MWLSVAFLAFTGGLTLYCITTADEPSEKQKKKQWNSSKWLR